MKSLKILLLNTQMEAAGAQKALLSLASGLKQEGHDVTVVTMYDKGEYVPQFRQQYGVDIIDLGMKKKAQEGRLTALSRVLRGVSQLFRLMRGNGFQVIQTYSHYSNIVGPVMAWFAGIPVRISSQRMSLRGAPGWLLTLDRLVANSFLVDYMVTVSEGTRQFAIEQQRINPNKLVTIHNGVDTNKYTYSADKKQMLALRRELALEPTTHVVITVARLHRQKGHRYLIEAIPKILDTVPATRFVFVGEGVLEEELRSQTEEMGLQPYVLFLGVRNDIPELLSISDVFALPSLWEGLPNVALEAMSVGVPVVASDVDGCPEVIMDGQTGILVPPADAESLAQAILKLLTDDELRLKMGEASRDIVDTKFSQEANIRAYINLYNHVIIEKHIQL